MALGDSRSAPGLAVGALFVGAGAYGVVRLMRLWTEREPAVGLWLRTHAGAYGFHNTVPSEPWHWEFWP